LVFSFVQSFLFCLIDVETYKNKLESLEKEVKEEKEAECTGRPILIASYMREELKERKERSRRKKERDNDEIRRMRSHSAPSHISEDRREDKQAPLPLNSVLPESPRRRYHHHHLQSNQSYFYPVELK
jgi:hypothetical protein